MSATFSLLQPSGTQSDEFSLHASAVEDLDLDYLASVLDDGTAGHRRALRYLTNLPQAPQTVEYRQAVIRDVMESAGLRETLDRFLSRGLELNFYSDLHKDQVPPFLQAVWRLGELELYVEQLAHLDDRLSQLGPELRSEGFRNLVREVHETRETPVIAALERELPRIRAGLGMKRSVTLGVNLDHKLRPVEAGIISVNDSPIQEQTLMSRLFGTSEDALHSVVPLHRTPASQATPGFTATSFPLAPLFQDLDAILKSASKMLVRRIRAFTAVDTSFLSRLRDESAFILSVARSFEGLARAGFPVSFPRILPAESRTLTAIGFYNPVLALRSQRDGADWMVRNEVHLTPDDGIQLLTGPNLGGKTTYVQGVGLLQVLAQAGLPVPATEASVSPVDTVMTHFPARETGEPELGRLGDEARRLSAIFDDITERSLVLLNESLTSTSPAESEYLAEDIVRGLRIYGARALYATHLHALAARAAELSMSTEGATGIVSLVSRVLRSAEATRRTFEIVKDEPVGTSFAADIARDAGIDLERLRERHGNAHSD